MAVSILGFDARNGGGSALAVLVAASAGAVLVFAAGLEAWQFIQSPIPRSRWQGLPDFEAGLIGFESFLGLWLMSRALPGAARRVAIGCCSVFACHTLFEALSGRTDCGCFGQVKVNPWCTFILDIAIVLALVFLAKSAAGHQRKTFANNKITIIMSRISHRRTYIL